MIGLLVSTSLDMIIRYCLRDEETYIVDNVLDFKKLASRLGCDYFSQMALESNLSDYIRVMSEKLYQSHILEGIEEERKKVIINQICDDIKSLNISDKKLIEMILKAQDIKVLIEKESEEARNSWSEKEKGIYNNCVRYISDAIINFESSLPNFTMDAIKILYHRDEEAFANFSQQLEQIIKLLKTERGTQDEYRDFETDYLRKVERTYKKIELFGSNISERNIKRYNISTSYIELSCAENDYDEITDTTINMSNIFNSDNIVWISGEAGGGKTTFIQWLATTSAMRNSDIEDINSLIPIVLKLRNVSFPLNLKSEIEKVVESECPNGWVEYLYKYDKILLLFDGIDEISNNDRESLYNYIEDIADEWKKRYGDTHFKSKIVITARTYVEDTFLFQHANYKILRMKMNNIKKFVLYWHKTVLADKEDEIKNRVDRLIENISSMESIRNIAGTPLLCAMICALSYVNNESIPTNRVELYEKCCHMLIEDRDRERKIISADRIALINLDYSKKVRILENIALYMLESQRAEMDKKYIVDYIRVFLKDSTIIEVSEIKEKPELLIDYLIQRTGILRQPTVGNIDFVHKTFLEYLAANAINKQCKWNVILANIVNPFWKETIIMCFSQIDRQQGSELLYNMLEKYKNTKEQEYIFMASLCANSASDIEVSVRDKINEKIKMLIPPQRDSFLHLAEAGQYILPFLYDKDVYGFYEKSRCINLLSRILEDNYYTEEIPVLLSYMFGNADFQTKNRVAEMLVTYPENFIDENNVKEKMYQSICKTLVREQKCILSIQMLRLLRNPLRGQSGTLDNVKKLQLIFGYKYIKGRYETDAYNLIDRNVYKYFHSLEELELLNIATIQDIFILHETKNLKILHMIVFSDQDMILDKLAEFSCTKSLNQLYYYSNDTDYICDNDLRKLKELEELTLYLKSPNLEIHIENWKFSGKLNKVSIIVGQLIFEENHEKFKMWRKEYPNIDFSFFKIGKID